MGSTKDRVRLYQPQAPCLTPTTLNSFCKGRTLHSFVRDPKTSLDINKTRQIAQEIIKVRGSPAAGGGFLASSRAPGCSSRPVTPIRVVWAALPLAQAQAPQGWGPCLFLPVSVSFTQSWELTVHMIRLDGINLVGKELGRL